MMREQEDNYGVNLINSFIPFVNNIFFELVSVIMVFFLRNFGSTHRLCIFAVNF
jgi:hypothetical protein